MNTNAKTAGLDRRVLLSTLWIFAVLNYLYCDLMSLMDADLLKQYLAGTISGMETTQGFFLSAAVLMEIPMSMVLLSRVLKYGPNRWANIIAGIIMTLVQITTLFLGSGPTLVYTFFSIVEIASTALVVWLAWSWRNADGSPDDNS